MTLTNAQKNRFGYDLISSGYDKYIATRNYLGPEKVFNSVADRIQPEDASSILDVGVGTGLLSQKFREWAGERFIAGVDISFGMLHEAKQKGMLDQAVETDVTTETLPFNDNYFDAAVSTGVTEYLESLDNVMDEMVRVTKPNGLLSFTTSSGIDILPKVTIGAKELLLKVLGGGDMVMNTYSRKPAEINEMLESRGCEVLETQAFEGYRATGGAIRYNLHVARLG